MSLRARLAWTYGTAVFVVVALLATVSLTAIDRSLRSSLDARLSTAAAAAVALVDIQDGRPSLDSEDRKNLMGALGGSIDAAVFSQDGGVLAASASAIPPEIAPLVAQHPSTNGAFSAGHGDGEIRVVLAPIERNGRSYGIVAAWQGSDYIDEYDRSAIIAMALAALGVGGIVVLLSATLARRALAPLERFTALATEIEASDLSRRVDSQSVEELRPLGYAFNRMLDRIEAAFLRQRRFTADASHELRAPLAVIRAEADVALGKERGPDEYRRALSTIVEEVERIDHLVDALLVAARADAANLEHLPVDMAEIAATTTQRFAPAAAARGITAKVTAVPALVSGDAQALERAVAALLHNALDHAKTRVVVDVVRDDESVDVVIADDGPGFSEEGLAHATERFWRGDPARRRGGTGLGLSIVDAIVRAHGGTVMLANTQPHGARVVMKLPFIGASSRERTIGS